MRACCKAEARHKRVRMRERQCRPPKLPASLRLTASPYPASSQRPTIIANIHAFPTHGGAGRQNKRATPSMPTAAVASASMQKEPIKAFSACVVAIDSLSSLRQGNTVEHGRLDLSLHDNCSSLPRCWEVTSAHGECDAVVPDL